MPQSPNKRMRDIAILAPIGGLLLFLPPYVEIFDQPTFLFGIPLLHIYLFSVWAVGIFITAIIARRYARNDRWPSTDKKQDTGRLDGG